MKSALDILNEKIAKDETPEAYYERARYHAELNEQDLCMYDLKKSFDLNYLMIDKASEELDRFKNLMTNPDFRRLFFPLEKINKIVEEIMYKGKFEEAIKGFTELEKTKEYNPVIHFYVSICYTQLNQLSDALLNVDKFTQNNPNCSDGYFNKAWILESTDRPDEAVEAYLQAVKIYPRHKNSFYNLGKLSLNAAKYEKAVAFFSSALTIDPFFRVALYDQAIALTQIGKTAEARINLDKLFGLDPKAIESARENKILSAII